MVSCTKSWIERRPGRIVNALKAAVVDCEKDICSQQVAVEQRLRSVSVGEVTAMWTTAGGAMLSETNRRVVESVASFFF